MNFFFFNDTATTEIYTLSLHDALPIFLGPPPVRRLGGLCRAACGCVPSGRRWSRSPGRRTRPARRHRTGSGRSGRQWPCEPPGEPCRSEEHTSELQSRQYLVCRLLLEKKKSTSKYLKVI